MFVRNVMKKTVVTCKEKDTLKHCADLMREWKIGMLPVVDAKQQLVGILTDRDLLDKIPDFHPYAGMVAESPVAVLVCGDTRQEKHPGMWVQDCAAATQNLLLAAHAKGLGAVWVGVHPREDRIQGAQRSGKKAEGVTLAFAVCPAQMLLARRLQFSRQAVPFIIVIALGEVFGNVSYVFGARNSIAIASRIGASTKGEGASSTIFWLRCWMEQSRSPK